MEWVETTGRTIEEAKDRALDQLGVDEQEAEFQILEEPKNGLFGRLRREARIRARVRPTRPRPKLDRRERRRRGNGKGNGKGRRDANEGRTSGSKERAGGRKGPSSRRTEPAAAGKPDGPKRSGNWSESERKQPTGAKGADDARGHLAAPTVPSTPSGFEAEPRQEREETRMSTAVGVDGQAELIVEFLEGLLDQFAVDADVTCERIDEDTVEVRVEGDDLGLLIGPKGLTLAAVQELARTVAQRRAPGPHEGRVRIDVGGYRQRRREALERFTRSVAEQVRDTGKPRALEPMSPPDRKVVHDTVNAMEGVRTTSEGVEPRRWVVILPAD